MLTHVHKVIHLVVGTFEKGLETSAAECPPVECGQSDGATGALDKKVGGHYRRWPWLDRLKGPCLVLVIE